MKVNELSDINIEPKIFEKLPIRVKAIRLKEEVVIETPEGDMKGRAGDYLIEGVNGEVYPCKEEIFIKTYIEVK